MVNQSQGAAIIADQKRKVFDFCNRAKPVVGSALGVSLARAGSPKRSIATLWTVHIETLPDAAEAMAEALGENPLALTILAPPRSRTARIEALYAQKPDRAALTAPLAVTAALHKVKMPRIDILEMPNLNWLRKVAADFQPLPGARWTIHGAQHRKAVPDRRRALQIDATNAFGTGEHPTTRGCLLMLDWLLKAGPRPRHMLDMGCGSGILAMAYAKTLHGHATAIDNDADSIRIAKDNTRTNGLAGEIRSARGQGYNTGLVRKNAPYDLIMSNIFARPLAVMARDVKRHLRPGGTVILSGFLSHQANLVLAAHRMQRLYPVKHFRSGDWVVLVLKRKISRKTRRRKFRLD